MKGMAIMICVGLLCTGRALSTPVLQLYIEGATYDTDSESWVLADPESGSARLWAIGNVEGPGGQGPILDVHLAVAYPEPEDGPVTVTLNLSTTGDYGEFDDPSLSPVPTFLQTVTDGSIPRLNDGSPLPSHGVYGPGIDWQEFALGDFTSTDSPMGDFTGVFPSPEHQDAGQINVYEISAWNASRYCTSTCTTRWRRQTERFSHRSRTMHNGPNRFPNR